MGDDSRWLDKTCLFCGRFLEDGQAGVKRCPRCGAELPPAPGDAIDARP